MFKKNTWVAGLLAALTTIMLIGCVDALPPPEGEIVEVVRLSEIIKDAPDGVLKDDAAWAAVFGGTPFMKCGPATFTIITDGGVKKLKIDKMINTWGEGLDVRHVPTAEGNGGVGYKAGDEIYIKGTADPVGIFVNAKGGAYAKVANWSSDTVAFETTITLTGDDITNIKTGNPQTLRLHYDDGKGDSRKGVIIFEEIVVTGMRAEGEGPEAPPNYAVPGNGSYTVKPSTATEYYIDLNTSLIGQLTPPANFPAAKLEKTKLEVKFDKGTQTIFIPFDEDTKPLIVNAAKNGYTFDVTITGTQGGHLRWCFGADRGSNWNVTGWGGNDTSSFNAVKNLATTGSPDDLNGIVIQARPDGNDSAIATPYTVTITEIKVVPKAPANAVTAVNITLSDPIAGVPAPTSVNGTGWTGAITWVPALPSTGAFTVSTTYSAKIVISPSANYYLTNITAKINGAEVTYNSETKTILSKNFAATGATISYIPNGDLWKLSTWLTSNTAIGNPLQQAGNPTLTVDASGISVTGRTQGYEGFDILLNKIDARLDPAVYKIKVVVAGTSLTNSDGTNTLRVNIQGASSPYAWLATAPDAGVASNTAFTLTVDEIPANYLSAGNGSVRICTVSDKNSFKITNITITIVDKR